VIEMEFYFSGFGFLCRMSCEYRIRNEVDEMKRSQIGAKDVRCIVVNTVVSV